MFNVSALYEQMVSSSQLDNSTVRSNDFANTLITHQNLYIDVLRCLCIGCNV